MFNYVSKVVGSEMPVATGSTGEGSSTELSPEPDDVYYHFGGAALSSMLHKCYSNIHSCPLYKRSFVLVKITILKSLVCCDKSVIPPSLQYWDRGFMYFPDPMFMTFIKAVDNKVRFVANNNGIKKHGKQIIEVATHQIVSDSSLKKAV